MTINIQKCSNVTVNGTHNHTNCKPIYNITTGEFYASGLDTANALCVNHASVSAALNGRVRTIKGCRLCFVSKIMEHLEEINEQNRIRSERDRINAEKAAAYDTIMAEQEAKRKAKAKAEERVNAHKAKIEALRRQIEAESASLNEAETDLNQFDD
jgi:hypothetical protein